MSICLAILLLLPPQLQLAEAKFNMKKWKLFSLSKSDTEPHNLPERLALGSFKLADSTSKFVQSSVFLLSGLVTVTYLIRHLFMSSKEAAIEQGLVEKMLKAEGEAAQAAAVRVLAQNAAPPTHHSRVLRFVGQNYYAILVLFAFLNVCLVLCLCHLKFGRSAEPPATTLPERRIKRKRKRKRV